MMRKSRDVMPMVVSVLVSLMRLRRLRKRQTCRQCD
jgi:hypothetical protein